ncbi:MAG: DPP IV N-terminal domain-containing protein [Planctomycetes bacterium]|nr:DPP IV N-terminal domain-containing protein [Planctomycetota bacterium]
MTRARPALSLLPALLWATWTSAQQPAPTPPPAPAPTRERLTFATVLERGQALLPPQPGLRWLPAGHDAAAVMPTADGNEVLFSGGPGAGLTATITDARTALAALGRPVAKDAAAALPQWTLLDATTVRLQTDDAVWHWPVAEAKATRVLTWPPTDARDDSAAVVIAPGDQRAAFVAGHELHVTDRQGHVRRLTWDGSADVVYGGAAHRAEFGIAGGLFWSPDGRRLAFYREDQRPIAAYPYQDLSATPPTPRAGRYPMAGRTHSRVTIGLWDSQDQSLRFLQHDAATDVYWTNLTFTPNGRGLCVAMVERGQDRLELVQFSVASGARERTLLTEQDAQWVEPEHGPTFLADGRFLWWSPRDGHRHLWLFDRDGKPLGQVTRGAFDVQELLGLATDQQQLWFMASGEDPRQRHLFAAKIDGTEVKQITRERGTHQCSLSADRQFAFDLWSNEESAPSPRFVNLQTGQVEALPAPPPPLLQYELPTSRLFQVKASDESILYGHVLLPAGMQEGRKYPVLLYVYGGPHLQLVTDQWLCGAPLWLHGLANDGYIVCRLDNRGTPHRGIEFEQVIHRKMGNLEVEDQLQAISWLKQQPFVDPARIGVHGWSYGGYLTLRCMLLAPEVFACGVAGAPVTDWAQYETGYTERYMDTPAENAQGYEASSCLPLAGKLQGRLLLVHGTDDRTVMWSHSLAFVDRCVDAGVLLDYFPYPMQTHRLVGKDRPHFLRLLKDHLDRYLKPGS